VTARRFPALALILCVHPAAAGNLGGGNLTGNGALALAALVAANSPLLPAPDKAAMAALLDGEPDLSFAAGRKISIAADRVTCKAGDVDISRHSCTLAFGGQTATLSGRAAHELFATLIEVGVAPEGAAGTVYAGLTKLRCLVDPNEVLNKDGSGASCEFQEDSL
jgi:hypothetical protein